MARYLFGIPTDVWVEGLWPPVDDFVLTGLSDCPLLPGFIAVTVREGKLYVDDEGLELQSV